MTWFDAHVTVDAAAPRLDGFGFGPHPAPDDWPRALRDLLEAAAAQLRSG